MFLRRSCIYINQWATAFDLSDTNHCTVLPFKSSSLLVLQLFGKSRPPPEAFSSGPNLTWHLSSSSIQRVWHHCWHHQFIVVLACPYFFFIHSQSRLSLVFHLSSYSSRAWSISTLLIFWEVRKQTFSIYIFYNVHILKE